MRKLSLSFIEEKIRAQKVGGRGVDSRRRVHRAWWCSRQCDAKELRWQIRIDGVGVVDTAAAIKQVGRYRRHWEIGKVMFVDARI